MIDYLTWEFLSNPNPINLSSKARVFPPTRDVDRLKPKFIILNLVSYIKIKNYKFG